MLGSKNFFFYQDAHSMYLHRVSLETILTIKERSRESKKHYLAAFDYFCENPNKYDGATIVKDLIDIRSGKYYLDADAMVHDYEYIKGAKNSFKAKWASDVRYIKNMELNGKGVRLMRLIFLTILASYLPLTKIFKK